MKKVNLKITDNTLSYLQAFPYFKLKLEEFKLVAEHRKSNITKFLCYSCFTALNMGLNKECAENVPEIELDDTLNLIALGKELNERTGEFIVDPAFNEFIFELKRDAIDLLKVGWINYYEGQHLMLFLMLIFLYESGDLTTITVREVFGMLGMFKDLAKGKFKDGKITKPDSPN